MRCWYLLLLLALSVTVSAEALYSPIQGMFKYDDGFTCGNVTIKATVGKESYSFTTENDGTFMGVIQVGSATFTVDGTKTAVNIVAGQVNKVTIS